MYFLDPRLRGVSREESERLTALSSRPFPACVVSAYIINSCHGG